MNHTKTKHKVLYIIRDGQEVSSYIKQNQGYRNTIKSIHELNATS